MQELEFYRKRSHTPGFNGFNPTFDLFSLSHLGKGKGKQFIGAQKVFFWGPFSIFWAPFYYNPFVFSLKLVFENVSAVAEKYVAHTYNLLI